MNQDVTIIIEIKINFNLELKKSVNLDQVP